MNPSKRPLPCNWTLVAALDEAGVIGLRNKLPWHVPEDLQYFKRITWGKPVLMGRNTCLSLGKPLSGRENWVLTRHQEGLPAGDWHWFGDLESVLLKSAAYEEVMVIGGARLYEAALPWVKRLLLSRIPGRHAGDVYFPKVNWGEWRLVRQQPMNTFTVEEWTRLDPL